MEFNEIIIIFFFNSNQQISSQTDTQLAQLKERMSGMEQEFEFLNDDRMRLQNDNDDLKKRMQAAEKEKEGALRKCHKEVQEHGYYIKNWKQKNINTS